MKKIIRCIISALAFGGAQVAVAKPDCASALVPRSGVGSVPLPAACQSMGALRIGMPAAEVLKMLGAPDAGRHWHGVSEMVYVFPRNLAQTLRKHPATKQYFWSRAGVLRIFLKADRVVTLDSYSPSAMPMPYSVTGVAIGADVGQLLGEARLKPSWNASGDNAFFAPYPLEVSTDEGRSHVTGVTIATPSMTFGPEPAFRFSADRRTGLITGYQVLLLGDAVSPRH